MNRILWSSLLLFFAGLVTSCGGAETPLPDSSQSNQVIYVTATPSQNLETFSSSSSAAGNTTDTDSAPMSQMATSNNTATVEPLSLSAEIQTEVTPALLTELAITEEGPAGTDTGTFTWVDNDFIESLNTAMLFCNGDPINSPNGVLCNAQNPDGSINIGFTISNEKKDFLGAYTTLYPYDGEAGIALGLPPFLAKYQSGSNYYLFLCSPSPTEEQCHQLVDEEPGQPKAVDKCSELRNLCFAARCDQFPQTERCLQLRYCDLCIGDDIILEDEIK